MRKAIQITEAIFPMPVLMIGTYNENGSVNVMNAAWGMMLSTRTIALKLSAAHKTVQNIKTTKAFTVHIADAAHAIVADYFGIVSGNTESEKFRKSGLTAVPSGTVYAPVIQEFPICMECEFIEYQDGPYGCGVVGNIVQVTADESILKDNAVDIAKVSAIAFDPYSHGYYQIGQRIGTAFHDGLQVK